jgi:hypothetical protein
VWKLDTQVYQLQKGRAVVWALLMAHRVRREKLAELVAVAAPDDRQPATATVVAHTTRGPWQSHWCAVCSDDDSAAASGDGVHQSACSWWRCHAP